MELEKMLESLLTPDSIAVIGASSTPGKVGYEILFNLINGGYQGAIIPVNPRHANLLGIDAYPDLKSHRGKVDLSIIAVPTKHVYEAIESSIDSDVKSIIIITAGFRETGEKGLEEENRILKKCQSAGVNVMGPNCLGLINTHHKMNASFAKNMPRPGGISVISQSGALCTAILDWAAMRHAGLAKLISFGNKADLDECDFLQALAADENTRVIAGYLESVSCGDKFIKTAEAVAAIKPVVLLKVGITDAGIKAASSHTGSLAGHDIAYRAAFKRAGVIRADTFESLFDSATAFAMQPVPNGDRVAIITNAGGPGIMAADAVEMSGMHVARLASATSTALRKKLPAAASVGNPIDVLGDADPERYATAVRSAQDDDSVNSIIVLLTPQAMTYPRETADAISSVISGEKPVLAAFMGGQDVMPGRDELTELNLPDYTSPERAVAALKTMLDYATWKKRPPRVVTRFPVNRKRVERVINRHQKLIRREIGEVYAKDILRAYAFNVPEGHIAYSGDEAVEIAVRIGFPVALKIVSPDILHKSDLGGVKLNLATSEAVQDAYDLMMVRVHREAPEAKLEGVYVEQMASPGMEVILGMSRDPHLGPMLMFGLGGIFVEVMKDVTFHLAPITSDEAMQMLSSTRSYELLKGARGRKGVDITSIGRGLQRISQLVTDFPEIDELDINPYMVYRAGSEPVVTDARMSVSLEGRKNDYGY